MKTIPLTKGYQAIVDEADFGILSQFTWYYEHGYAARRLKEVGRKKVYMHRQLLGFPEGKICDHVNGEGLDNRRVNIRICTQVGNQGNRRVNRNNKTGLKGVRFIQRMNNYEARITTNGKAQSLGYFKTAQEASKAYIHAATLKYGEFARAR